MELIDRIEQRIDALPGLAGLDLVRTGIADATATRDRGRGIPAPAGRRERVANASRSPTTRPSSRELSPT